MGKKVLLIGLFLMMLVAPVYADDMIYVSNAGDKTLSIVSTDTDKIIDTFAVGTSGSWPSNQWNKKYIALNTKKGVDIVNALTKEVVVSLDLKSKKNWQDFTPDGKLLVTASRDVDISYFIDMDESSETFGQVVAQVQWPEKFGICDMTISSDGKYAYIPGIFSDKFGVLDIENKQILATIDIPRIDPETPVKPFMTTVTWDDKYVFMENSEGKGKGTESVIDVSDPANPKEVVRFVPEESLEAAKAALEPKGITVKKMLGLEPQSDEITLDNKYAFIIMRASKSVAVVDIGTLEMIKEIPLTADGKPRTGDLSPDGSKLYVSVPEKNVVDVIDVETLTKVKTIEGFSKPQGIIGVKERYAQITTTAQVVEELNKLKKKQAEDFAHLEGELHELEETLEGVKATAEAAKAEGKGICGPTALLALAMLPLGAYRLYRRRK